MPQACRAMSNSAIQSPNTPRGKRILLLAPAVAVMNRLSYPRKFALISLLFILPLALVFYFFNSEINIGVGIAQKEIMGDAYLRPLRKLLEHTPQAQLLAHDYASGKTALRPELIAAISEMDADFKAVLAAENAYGKTLDTD